jgi:hypothetical protein
MGETGQDTKIHPRPRIGDAKFETSRGVIIDPAVEAGFGDARRRGDGATGGCRIQGDSEKHHWWSWRRELQGNLEARRWQSRRIRIQEDLKRRQKGGTLGAGSQGNLEACDEGPLKDGRFEETWRTVAGTVGRRGARETRRLNRRPEGLMRGSVCCEIIVIERPETKVSGLFVFLAEGDAHLVFETTVH